MQSKKVFGQTLLWFHYSHLLHQLFPNISRQFPNVFTTTRVRLTQIQLNNTSFHCTKQNSKREWKNRLRDKAVINTLPSYYQSVVFYAVSFTFRFSPEETSAPENDGIWAISYWNPITWRTPRATVRSSYPLVYNDTAGLQKISRAPLLPGTWSRPS